MNPLSICIVGLGYVGLPLAYSFAKHGYTVYGFDISERRISDLKQHTDQTNELTAEELGSIAIEYSTDPHIIGKADIVIVALPTPVDENNKPDLTILEAGSKTVGKYLKPGMIVVYESTVYPGVTEDICGKILERESGLISGKDFFLGYSPERINPGDKEHTVETIVKIVAGQNEQTTDTLCELYGSIVKAGIHRAPSIKVAEMAKAIENAQRDINIAYMNEIAMLCARLGIRTKDVLNAAGTKWNFLRFRPGLVGGHCIGVDPYYLVEKAKMLGMDTNLITAGRTINDGMAAFVVAQLSNALAIPLNTAKVLVLGLTFKENVPDTRNSKVADVITLLKKEGATVHAHDPMLSREGIEAMGHAYGSLEEGPYDAVLLLVPHVQYIALDPRSFVEATGEAGVIFDLASALAKDMLTASGRTVVEL